MKTYGVTAYELYNYDKILQELCCLMPCPKLPVTNLIKTYLNLSSKTWLKLPNLKLSFCVILWLILVVPGWDGGFFPGQIVQPSWSWKQNQRKFISHVTPHCMLLKPASCVTWRPNNKLMKTLLNCHAKIKSVKILNQGELKIVVNSK